MSNILQLGVCDYPEHVAAEAWREHAEKQKALGLTFVRLAEFAWSLIEPHKGQFNWQWLDDAIAVYEEFGLKIVLGTPTATPPAWLISDHPEILPIDEAGGVKKFGSRRHYDYASPVYLEHSRRIVTEMAKRYGNHSSVAGWQIDNEHGHEGSAISYGGASAQAFPKWLQKRYTTLENLNNAWGTVFWSQQYTAWEQISPPNRTAVGQPNPSHTLDYRRFCSDMIEYFQSEQIDILRRLSPDRFITHNFVIFSSDIDIYRIAEKLDFVAWDSYPIGMLEFFATWETEDNKTRFARTGHPDLVSVNHDIYRGLKNGKPFWVMEQQCGHANWAQYNPLPADGAVKLWSTQAWAHGADAVIYFRWRAAHMAQEIMHSGLLQADGREDRGFHEVMDFDKTEFSTGPVKNRVALLNDYHSLWMYSRQRHNQDLSYWRQFMLYYRVFRKLGIGVDIIHPNQMNPEDYDLVVAPCLLLNDPEIAGVLKNAAKKSQLILGPRTGFYDVSGKVPTHGQFEFIEDLVGIKLANFDSMRPTLSQTVTCTDGESHYNAILWCEAYDVDDAEILYHYEDGPLKTKAAVTQKGNTTVIGAHSPDLARAIIKDKLDNLGMQTYAMPEGVRLSRRDGLTFLLNFNEKDIEWNGIKVPAVSYKRCDLE